MLSAKPVRRRAAAPPIPGSADQRPPLSPALPIPSAPRSVNVFAGLLTNVEVYELLRSRQASIEASGKEAAAEEESAGAKNTNTRRKRTADRQRKDVVRKALKYFDGDVAKHHSVAKTRGAIKALGDLPYEMTTSEKLQLVNAHARTEVDLHLILEECESRIKTDEEMQEVIACIAGQLGTLPDEDGEEDGEDGDGDGDGDGEGVGDGDGAASGGGAKTAEP